LNPPQSFFFFFFFFPSDDDDTLDLDVNAELGGAPFGMTVRFEGPDVYGGFADLVKTGVAEAPLPRYLAEAHSHATSHFVVRDGGAFEPR
jgi:hypothetical protein